MKTSYSDLGIHSPCYTDPNSKIRNGARVYCNEEYMGEVEEVKLTGDKGKIITLANGKTWIAVFGNGKLNGTLFFA